MRIIFSSDLHGSEKCFRKFINSGPFYKADVLVLGGDITGKAICCILKEGAVYRAELFGRQFELDNGKVLEDFEEKVRFNGFYPYRCEQEELTALALDKVLQEKAFMAAMLQTMNSWMEWADDRLRQYGIECFAITGNDDYFDVDQVFENRQNIHLINCIRTPFLDWEIFGYPTSNKTPWDSPREKEEDAIEDDLIELSKLEKEGARNLIWNVHVPPYNSGLDSAPELSKDLKPQFVGGSESVTPVGSQSVRNMILRYQPLLALHGHVHESRGIQRLGRTLCINPGSRYNEGALLAAIIDINRDKVKNYQLVTG